MAHFNSKFNLKVFEFEKKKKKTNQKFWITNTYFDFSASNHKLPIECMRRMVKHIKQKKIVRIMSNTGNWF